MAFSLGEENDQGMTEMNLIPLIDIMPVSEPEKYAERAMRTTSITSNILVDISSKLTTLLVVANLTI